MKLSIIHDNHYTSVCVDFGLMFCIGQGAYLGLQDLPMSVVVYTKMNESECNRMMIHMLNCTYI